MAGEIQASGIIQITSGNFTHFKQLTQDNQDLDTNVAAGGIVEVDSTPTAIPLADVTNPGWSYFRNLSATTTLEIGVDASGFEAFLRLLPGQIAGPMPLGAAPYAAVESGTAQLEYYILERETEAS